MPFAVALVVYFLGRAAYFRQKEYELITKRYLEEGLDAIARNIDKSLGLFRHNWAQSLVVLKHFRDLGKDMQPKLYQEPFRQPEPDMFEIWRDYRLYDLVDDDIFNLAHQALDAFIRDACAFFENDLGAMVRVTIEGGKEIEVKASREAMTARFLKEIERLNKESLRFYELLGEIAAIARIIQRERFGFSRLGSLPKRREVRERVANLKRHFQDVLPVDQPAQPK
jgi:hypothetical protein